MRVFENVVHCNGHKGKRKEDRYRGHVHKLNSISYLRSYYFLVTVTLSSRWARGGGGGVTKRLR